jgi:hypothetical protein
MMGVGYYKYNLKPKLKTNTYHPENYTPENYLAFSSIYLTASPTV